MFTTAPGFLLAPAQLAHSCGDCRYTTRATIAARPALCCIATSSLFFFHTLAANIPMFHRAVLLGGSALSKWAIVENPRQIFYLFAEKSGCNPFEKAKGFEEQSRTSKTLADC